MIDSKEILNKVMNTNEFSRTKMSDVFGVSRNQMHKYLNGSAQMKADRLLKGLENLGYSISIIKESL